MNCKHSNSIPELTTELLADPVKMEEYAELICQGISFDPPGVNTTCWDCGKKVCVECTPKKVYVGHCNSCSDGFVSVHCSKCVRKGTNKGVFTCKRCNSFKDFNGNIMEFHEHFDQLIS